MYPQASTHTASEMPQELAGPLPRRVETDSDDARYVLMLVLIFLVGGALIFGWYTFGSLNQVRQRAALRSEGREVVGEVTDLTTGRGTEYVKYSFTFGGKSFSGKARIPGHSGIVLHKQDRIIIRFLPSDPAVNHPYAWEWSALMDIVPIGFQAFFALIALAGLIYLLRERRLAREGIAALGVVTSCTLNDRRFQIKYEFRTKEGALMAGSSDCKDSRDPGASIWILYLPHRPQRNDCYPLSNFRIVG